MSGRRYEGPSSCLIGWSTAWAQVMLDDGITVSFKFSGHRSSEEATQALKRDNRESRITVLVQIIISI